MSKGTSFFLWMLVIGLYFLCFNLAWIGAKYLFEGEVVHTWVDYMVALGIAYLAATDAIRPPRRGRQNNEWRH